MTWEEVPDAMPFAIEAAMERENLPASGLCGDADADAKRIERSREGVSVEAFVSDKPSASQRPEQWFDSELIVTLSTVQNAGARRP